MIKNERGNLLPGQTGRCVTRRENCAPISLLSVKQFLKRVKDAPGLFLEDAYFVFMFKPMHNLLLGISKLLNNCFVSYFGSGTLCTKKGGSDTVGRKFLSVKDDMLFACNSFLATSRKRSLYLDWVLNFER